MLIPVQLMACQEPYYSTRLILLLRMVLGMKQGRERILLPGNNSRVEGSILSRPLSEIDDTAPTTIYESELEGLSGDTNIILQATNDIRLQDLSDDRLDLAAGAKG